MAGEMWKSTRGGEPGHSTLYARIEIPQRNPFVQLIHANKKIF
jgi:hypothetical protein